MTAAGGFWCFCIEYLLGAAATRGSDRGRSRVDFKQVLSESDFAVFAKLREVRKQIAAEEAVPVYAVCTNEQLAEMAKSRAGAVGDLKKIVATTTRRATGTTTSGSGWPQLDGSRSTSAEQDQVPSPFGAGHRAGQTLPARTGLVAVVAKIPSGLFSTLPTAKGYRCS